MIGGLSWKIALGGSFLLIGLTIIITALGYQTGALHDLNYMIMVYLFLIFVVLSVVFFTAGILDRRRLPFPPPLFPIPPANVGHEQSAQIEIIYCKSCNKQIPNYSKYCLHCGEKQVKI